MSLDIFSRMLKMAEEQIFEDYDEYPVTVLRDLMERRGLNPNRFGNLPEGQLKNRYVQALTDLDETIDNLNEDHEYTYDEIVTFARNLGFDVNQLPQRNNPNAIADIGEILEVYANGQLDENLLTEEGRRKYAYAQERYAQEDGEDIFQGYEDLTLEELQELLGDRGLPQTNNKDQAVEELEDLDEAIDTTTEDLTEGINDPTYAELVDIATRRGFRPNQLPRAAPDAELPLLELLNDYEAGELDINFLTPDGQKRYEYAQRRYQHNEEEENEEEIDAAMDALFDPSPPITPRRREGAPTTVNVPNRGEPQIPQADIPARRVTALVTPTRRGGPETTVPAPATPVTPVRRNLPPTIIRRPGPRTPQTPPPVTTPQPTAPRREIRRPLGNIPPVRRINFEEPEEPITPITPRRRNLPPTQVRQPQTTVPPPQIRARPTTTRPPVPTTGTRQIQFLGQALEIPSVEQINRWSVDQLTVFLGRIGVNQIGLRRKADYTARALEMRDLLIRLSQDNNTITEQEWNQNLPANLRRRGGLLIPGNVELRDIRDIERMTVPQLKDWLDRHGVNRVGVNNKANLVDLVAQTQGIVRTRLTQDLPTLPTRIEPIQPPTGLQLPPFQPFPGFVLPQVTRPTIPQTTPQQITDPREAIEAALKSRAKVRNFGNPIPNGTFTVNELAEHVRLANWYLSTNARPATNPIEYILLSNDPNTLATSVLAQLQLTPYLPNNAGLREKTDLLWDLFSINEKGLHRITRPLLIRGPTSLRTTYPRLRNLSDREIAVLLYKGRPAFTPAQPNPQALAEIDAYTPPEIVKIVRYLIRAPLNLGYGVRIPQNSYYEAFLSQPPSPLIPFILNWQEGTDPTEVAVSVGMLFPPGIGDDQASLIRYFTENIRDYAPIYTRPDPIDPPPILEDIPAGGIDDVIRQYTDDELLDAYEITFTDWTSRRDFLAKIVEEATGGAKWSFRNRNCINLEREDPITLEEPEVNNPQNPLISYGTLTNYRCYNVNELVENFKDDKDVGFVFAVPDWVNPTLNPVVLATYKYPLPDFREFPLASMKQLKRLLRDERNPVYNALKTKIDQGITAKNNITRLVNQLRQEYQQMPLEDQQLVQDYIAWLFLLGMYMRFWKGPGFVFPMQWVEGGGGAERCELNVRDKNTSMMFGTRTALLEGASPDLEKWLLALPRVRYDFRTGAVAAGQETIDYIVQEAQLGNFCLADASDQMLRTSYYYALKLLGMSNEDFNTFIRETLQTPTQPAFDPTRVTGTGHTDPFHNLREVDEE